MSPRTRAVLNVVALVYVTAVGVLFGDVALRVFNLLLASTVVPLVWLIWVFCRWSAHQHANRWARDIAKVHGNGSLQNRAGERVR